MIIRNNAFNIEGHRDEQAYSIEIINKNEIIVIGVPPDESENDAENTHNCDEMGCGFNHILFRAYIVSEDDNAELAVYPER
jgi:hypothetical protein